ncbi:CDP-glycerol glycerophosphotransferase family protein [Microbacterium elymi]|uniref:CDP-glycerol glycerophosphotransferase family protein n=1 Tax=Microbacterium elymi TaxID=2909587 RepID=UPI00338F9B3A
MRKPKPGFRESPFIQSLLAVLNDERLKALSERGYTIKFVPHPNLAAHFPYADVPPYVSVTTYDSTDVQELIGSAAVFLTDYSSVAFDAAFAGASRRIHAVRRGRHLWCRPHALPGIFRLRSRRVWAGLPQPR